MNRTPLRRTKRLARGASKLSRSRLRPIGKRGRADREALAAVRSIVLARAAGRCQRCGRRGRLDLHHLLARSQGGKHEAGNLAALCSGVDGCHARVTDHRAADWRAWIVTRGGAA